MLQFLFGRGWWITWYVCFWLVVMLGLLLPTLAFLPLKRAGEKPDTASLGSVAMVMFMAVALGLATLLGVGLFGRIVAVHWFHKLTAAMAFGTVLGVIAYFPAVHLATVQKLPALLLWAGYAAAVVAGNLVLLWYAQTRAPGSMHWHMPWYVAALLFLVALPAMGFIVLMFVAPIINWVRFRQ